MEPVRNLRLPDLHRLHVQIELKVNRIRKKFKKLKRIHQQKESDLESKISELQSHKVPFLQERLSVIEPLLDELCERVKVLEEKLKEYS